MRKLIMAGILGVGVALSMPALWAGEVAEAAKSSFIAARESLIALIEDSDTDNAPRHLESIRSASVRLDEIVAKNPEVLKEFNEVWSAFKTTREQEIIPSIQQGDRAKARKLASGIQTERYKTMMSILGQIPQ